MAKNAAANLALCLPIKKKPAKLTGRNINTKAKELKSK
jgi:hypothetical protein